MLKNSANPISTSNGKVQSSSRERFEHYRKQVKQKELPAGGYHSTDSPRSAKNRVRSATQLAWQFFHLLRAYRFQTFLILLSAAVATLIGLLPPAGTKVVIDYGLNHQPLPQRWLSRFPSLADPKQLLLFVVIAVSVISLVKIVIQLWGRW